MLFVYLNLAHAQTCNAPTSSSGVLKSALCEWTHWGTVDDVSPHVLRAFVCFKRDLTRTNLYSPQWLMWVCESLVWILHLFAFFQSETPTSAVLAASSYRLTHRFTRLTVTAHWNVTTSFLTNKYYLCFESVSFVILFIFLSPILVASWGLTYLNPTPRRAQETAGISAWAMGSRPCRAGECLWR